MIFPFRDRITQTIVPVGNLTLTFEGDAPIPQLGTNRRYGVGSWWMLGYGGRLGDDGYRIILGTPDRRAGQGLVLVDR